MDGTIEELIMKACKENSDKLVDEILDILIETAETGISSITLQNQLRHRGWEELGTCTKFRRVLRVLGFTVSNKRNGYIVRLGS